MPDASALLVGTNQGGVLRCSLAEVERARAAAAGPGKVAPAGVRVDVTTTEVVPGGPASTVWGMAASPDGKWFATADHSGAVHIWDGTGLKLVHALRGHALAW